MPALTFLARRIAANDARDSFSELLGRAQHGKERVVIDRHGKPAAAIVPVEDLQLLESIEDARDAKEAREALAAWERHGRRTTSLNRVARDLGLKG